MDFEWDDDKAEANWRKHRVSFEEAVRVFDDPCQFNFEDNSVRYEDRFNVVGMMRGRLVTVTYTIRGDKYRIVSARGAEPHEKRKYHEI